MFLTDADIIDLTGYVKPGKQITWLTREGFTFRVAADGHPRVLREHANKMMGISATNVRQKTRPDFSALGV